MRTRDLVLLSGIALVACALAVARSETSHGADIHHGRVVAYDLVTGAVRFDTEGTAASVHIRAIGSGVIAMSGADSCSVSGSGSIWAVSIASGARRWQRTFGDACSDYGSIAPMTHGVMAVPGRHGVEGWNARDGTTRWVSRGLQSPSASTRIVEAVSSDRGTVTFLDGRSGRIRAQGRAPSHPTAWLLQGRTAVLVTQGSWRTGPVQRLTALDVQTGRQLWQRRVSPGNGFGGPSGDEGVVLLDWSGRTTHAYATDTGRPLWTHDAIEAAGSGLALLHDGGSLVALDLRTGRERWRVAAEPGQIAVGSGAVAVIGSTISVFDGRTGARRWISPAPSIGARSGVPVIAGNRLLVPVPSPFYEPYVE